MTASRSACTRGARWRATSSARRRSSSRSRARASTSTPSCSTSPIPFEQVRPGVRARIQRGRDGERRRVTYHDGFLFRDPPTGARALDRAEVVLHELAHMWFGDLVTMRWWDDLWLNESFATYMSLPRARPRRPASRRLAGLQRRASSAGPTGRTSWSPRTPSPPRSATPRSRFLNFDGITYGKGASVLKQLVRSIGRDAFRDGMRIYFERHAWGNATLASSSLRARDAAGEPLDDWADGVARDAVAQHDRAALARRPTDAIAGDASCSSGAPAAVPDAAAARDDARRWCGASGGGARSSRWSCPPGSTSERADGPGGDRAARAALRVPQPRATTTTRKVALDDASLAFARDAAARHAPTRCCAS